MTEGDISAALAMWREQGAADLPWSEIERALRRLPDAGMCAVSDDGTALFMLTRTDTVFTVSLDAGNVALRSRPLDADRLTVSLRWVGDSSAWTFRYTGQLEGDERWQDISGSVAVDGDSGRERPDDREQFARAVAGRAGWAHGTDMPSEVQAASSTPAEEAGENEPRWRQSVDVWGRPLDVKRR
jgi:hypothetical protein